MSRAWDLLKGKKSRQVSGADIEGVGSSIFIQPENKRALEDWHTMSQAPEVLTPKGGTIWADSLILAKAELSNSSLTLLPSTLYALEANANGYLCQLLGIYGYVAGGTSLVSAEWNDSVSAVNIIFSGNITTSAIFTFRPSMPLYFSEDVPIKITEFGSNTCQVSVCVAINKRGGNPQ